MSDRIYRMGPDGLTALDAEPFGDEVELEALIASHPELLGDDDRRWILVRRQQGIAETEDGNDRWSVDLLLIDQEAIPTLVEVKRGANRELRRMVVGQMLDYAANARHLRVDDLRESFETSAQASDRDPDTMLADLRGDDDTNAEEFWARVATNLQASRLRLLFVADRIPGELEQIVGFLNAQMPNVEVLAVEVKQFRAGENQTLVPTVIGALPTLPSSTGGNNWTRRTFPEAFQNPAHSAVARSLLEAASKAGATFLGYRSGISIRTRVHDIPLTVAWLLAPDRESSWQPVRQFAFGAGNANNPKFFDELPDDLRARLRAWADEFVEDDFTYKDPRTKLQTAGVEAWCVSYDDAATNLDVLVERLERVLTGLRAL